jgi:ammonia channel protein AmtB
MEFAGVKPGNAPHLLVKNFVQFSIAIVFYWFLGFGFSFRYTESEFIGEKAFGGDQWLQAPELGNGECFSFYVLLGTFMLFIINLSLVERATYLFYVFFPFLIMVFCWPAVVSWIYGDGWLVDSIEDEILDLGADIVVYVFAGGFSFVSVLLIGRRSTRYSEAPNSNVSSPVLYTIGCFLTILGIFGITVAQQPLDKQAIYSAMHNLWISAACCGIVSLKIITWFHSEVNSHYVSLYQGFIAGMVIIASSSGNTTPWQAGIIGTLAGGVFSLVYFSVRKVKIDDGLDVFATFLVPGIFGGLLPGFLDDDKGVFWAGWESGQTLGTQTVGTFVVLAWSAFWALVVAGGFKVLKILRLSDEIIAHTLSETIITHRGFTTDRKMEREKV